MRGGGPCPNFLSTFHKLSIWGWGGRGGPLPNFFGTLAFKKSGTSCPNKGEGGRGVLVIWTKSKRTATFFRETFLKEDWNLHIIKLTYKTSWKGRQALNSGSFCPFRIDFVGCCVIRFTFLCKIAHFTYFQTQEERRPIPTGWLLGGWVPKIRFWAHDTGADHCVQLLTSQLAQDWSPFCEHVRT